MSGWSLYKGSDANWENKVAKVNESTYLHDNGWAENLKGLGWEVCRWSYQKDGESTALLQAFLKRYPMGIGVLWFHDWIAGDYKLGEGESSVLKKSLSLRFLIIRMRSHHQKNDREQAILKQDFRCALNPFDSGMTMYLNLSVSSGDLHQRLCKPL